MTKIKKKKKEKENRIKRLTATAPGKFAKMKPIAPPLTPPIMLQNLPVGFAVAPPSAMPCSRSISSKTLPNCSLLNFSPSLPSAAAVEEEEELPKPNADHGNPLNAPPAAFCFCCGGGRGISSSSGSGMSVLVEDEDEGLKPW